MLSLPSIWGRCAASRKAAFEGFGASLSKIIQRLQTDRVGFQLVFGADSLTREARVGRRTAGVGRVGHDCGVVVSAKAKKLSQMTENGRFKLRVEFLGLRAVTESKDDSIKCTLILANVNH